MKRILKFSLVKKQLDLSEDKLNAILSRNGWGPLVRHINNVSSIVVDGLTNNWVKRNISMMRRLSTIRQNQGNHGLVKYLKVCSVCLQQYLGGHYEPDLTSLGPRVKRTGKGIPKILPVETRKMIGDGDARAIRWALTIFALYRVILYPGKLKLSTIVETRRGTLQAEHDMYKYVNTFLGLFIQGPKPSLKQLSPPNPFPIVKSSPNSFMASRPGGEFSTHPSSLLHSVAALMRQPRMLRAMSEFSGLLPKSTGFEAIWEFCFRTIVSSFTKWISDESRNRDIWESKVKTVVRYGSQLKAAQEWNFSSNEMWNKNMTSFKDMPSFMRHLRLSPGRTHHLGKLGTKAEAAGKIRVFAMVDPFTQWLMNPLHKWLFNKLKKVEMDGTFDQMRPLTRVPFGEKPIYSFDLSAATDRLPVSLQERIIAECFGQRFARLWRYILVGRSYHIEGKLDLEKTMFSFVLYMLCNPEKNSKDYIDLSEWTGPVWIQKPETLKYSVGQPMGALSSWAMLALTHHFVVQVAAWKCGHSTKWLFRDYAVLGDDIVIWDKQVAESYYKTITSLGVEVGLAKSIISLDGTALEFAKKTMYKGQDVSPISLLEYSAALRTSPALIEFVNKYQAPMAFVKSVIGVGFRSKPTTWKLKLWTMCNEVPTTWERFSTFFNNFKDYTLSSLAEGWAGSLSRSHIEQQAAIVKQKELILLMNLLKKELIRLKEQTSRTWAQLIQKMTEIQVPGSTFSEEFNWYPFWSNKAIRNPNFSRRIQKTTLRVGNDVHRSLSLMAFEEIYLNTARRWSDDLWNIKGILRQHIDGMETYKFTDPKNIFQHEGILNYSTGPIGGTPAWYQLNSMQKTIKPLMPSSWFPKKPIEYKDVENLVRDLYRYQDSLDNMCPETIFDPKFDVTGLSPKKRDAARLRKLWEVWSTLIIDINQSKREV